MNLSFGTASLVTTLGHVSFVARRQARLCWQRLGGREWDPVSVDEMLAGSDVRWFVVCDDRGVPVVDVWHVADGALVFRAGTTELVGQALDHGFLSGDPAVWTAMAAARDVPELAGVWSALADAVDDRWERAPDTLREVA